ncbi:AbrB family transcriptional regulator [Kushneria phosphatilytica]|uniref:AbrB family transcriptional regulator n=1 Tax=Kushneria phosphatilytica TaxID=657387 RepID=UPI0008DAD3E0|nr:AbrB family transcriptional regulator [Kushneria phosphatilytica]OHV07676.1 hypothetical protein BH688_15920 [Kushneria phosphatilytica]
MRINRLHFSPLVLWRWLALIAACTIASLLLQALQMPAGAFIGPMAVAILFGISGMRLRLPRTLFKCGQGVVGCLIAQTMTLPILLTILQGWPVMLLAIAITLLLSLLVGIGLVRYGGLPGTTAAWGTTPGAAAAMVAMAEEANADPRIVAAMQYVRVICVVLVGALVSHWLGAGDGQSHRGAPMQWTPSGIGGLGVSLAVIALGVWVVDRLLPAGALLGPMVIGTVLHVTQWVPITLPGPLLQFAYALIGVYVGLRFDRQTVRNVTHAFKWMLLASLVLIAMCALSAAALFSLLKTDFVSAYLATSPGGLDSMTIIALDTHADIGIVAALQTLRLFTVILVGPSMARFIARFARSSPASSVTGKQQHHQ